MEEIADLPGRGLRLSVMFDCVTLTIVAKSEYEARVLFDDIATRLKDGESITIQASSFEKGKS